jgi:hypothetical protein
MTLRIEVSAGEFLDKLTILEIKKERIRDPVKLENVKRELGLLRDTWSASPLSGSDVAADVAALKRVNESLWDIEDRIRRCESAKAFDDEFIQLARSVYRLNDERAEIKRRLNVSLNSTLIEEKSYPDYPSPDGTEDNGG